MSLSRPQKKRWWKSYGIVTLEVLIVVAVLYSAAAVTRAGSLTPSASPAETMRTLQDIYNILAATSTVNASSSVASSTGNAIQIAQCIVTRLGGGSCP